MHQNDCNQHNGKHRSVADPDIQLEGPHHVADPDIWLETNNVSLYLTFTSSFEEVKVYSQTGWGAISPWICHWHYLIF